jgi:hypothetical protein
VQDEDAGPDLNRMIDMAWRRAARAVRAARPREAERWLAIHARLAAMSRPSPRDPAPDDENGEGPRPDVPKSTDEVHQLHQLHRCNPETSAKITASGPDPPSRSRSRPRSGP